ncbi:hypothetical protein [Micromonospora sp. LOL_021]|uniref:hypothetical protein n=1 Tax=Micromonospora sp. LOL_021 TaxID=3345417 RepID=UPI003A87A13A
MLDELFQPPDDGRVFSPNPVQRFALDVDAVTGPDDGDEEGEKGSREERREQPDEDGARFSTTICLALTSYPAARAAAAAPQGKRLVRAQAHNGEHVHDLVPLPAPLGQCSQAPVHDE